MVHGLWPNFGPFNRAQLAYKAFNTSFKPNGLGSAATSSHHCRCQPPSTATSRPTPTTSGNFSGGLQKKKKSIFFLNVFLFIYYHLLLFSNLNV
jgi:hypothetical protein